MEQIEFVNDGISESAIKNSCFSISKFNYLSVGISESVFVLQSSSVFIRIYTRLIYSTNSSTSKKLVVYFSSALTSWTKKKIFLVMIVKSRTRSNFHNLIRIHRRKVNARTSGVKKMKTEKSLWQSASFGSQKGRQKNVQSSLDGHSSQLYVPFNSERLKPVQKSSWSNGRSRRMLHKLISIKRFECMARWALVQTETVGCSISELKREIRD